jgi:hypothetical protein
VGFEYRCRCGHVTRLVAAGQGVPLELRSSKPPRRRQSRPKQAARSGRTLVIIAGVMVGLVVLWFLFS